MGTVKRITRNTVFLAGAEIISRMLQFFVMVYAARILGKTVFGTFSFGLAFAMIVIIFFDAGIYTLLVREIARKKEMTSKFVSNSISLKMIIGAVVFAAIFVFVKISGFSAESQRIIWIMSLFAFFSSFNQLLYSVFRAHEKMGYDASLKIIRMIVLSAGAVYVLKTGMGIFAFGWIFVLTEAFVVILGLMFEQLKFAKLKFELDISFIKYIFKESLPFGLAFTFGSIYFYIDSIMLSKMKGDAEVGIYSAGYNLAIAILFIPTVYTSAIYPVMSRYFKEKNKNLQVIYKKSFKYLYLLGLPISVGTYFLAGRIINIFYGAEYAEATIVLKIVACFIFIKFVNFLFGITLSSIDQQRSRTKAMMWTAIMNILLNIILIPKYGFVGASIATLVTEVFLFWVYYSGTVKHMGKIHFGKILWKPAIASVLMGAFIYFTPFTFYLEVISSALLYFALLFIMKAYDSEDIELIKKVFKGEKLQTIK